MATSKPQSEETLSALLLKSMRLLELNFTDKIGKILDYYQDLEYNRREYEWVIRKLSHQNRLSQPAIPDQSEETENLELARRDFMKSISRDELEIGLFCDKINAKLVEENSNLSAQLKLAQSEITTLKNQNKEFEAKHSQKCEEFESEIARLNNDNRSLENQIASCQEDLANARKAADLKTDDLSIILNETKELNFLQQQEIARLIQANDDLRRHGFSTIVDTPSEPATPTIAGSSRIYLQSGFMSMPSSSVSLSNHHYQPGSKVMEYTERISELTWKLKRQVELNERLKRLFNSHSNNVKLVDEYNQIYNRNIDLEITNKKLVLLLIRNNIPFEKDGVSVETDTIVADLIDQRNAWQENTRLLESQIYSLMQELEELRKTEPQSNQRRYHAAKSTPNLSLDNIPDTI